MSKIRGIFQCFFSNLLRSGNQKQIREQSMMSLSKIGAVALKELGYAFNANGELRKLNENGEPGEEPFQFEISSLHQECQVHYEEVGMAITNYIYYLLETQEGMLRLQVPEATVPATGTFIYATKEYDKKNTLMILIHGSGAVRAGQWARSLIINDNLDMGSQIPYIKRAVSKGYGVVTLNTNDNYRICGNKIPQSGTPDEHAQYVWDKYISGTKASSILIVAHSYGGVVAMNLAYRNKNDFKKKVKAMAFTDSVHGFSAKSIPDYVKKVTKNWISSTKPLDDPVNTAENEIAMVSAGHPKHEMTSYSCMDSVFKFFEEKLAIN